MISMLILYHIKKYYIKIMIINGSAWMYGCFKDKHHCFANHQKNLDDFGPHPPKTNHELGVVANIIPWQDIARGAPKIPKFALALSHQWELYRPYIW